MSEEPTKNTPIEWFTKSGNIASQFWAFAKVLGFVFGAFLVFIGFWIVYEFFLVLWGDTGTGDAFRNVGLIFLAVIGAPFVVWRSWVAQRQADTAAQQAQLAEDRSFSDLFTKAVEQLGADKVVKSHAKTKDDELAYDENGVPIMQEITAPNIEVRLGAIYALQRISRASEKDHIPIMETLCAYIRENAAEDEPEEFSGRDLPDKDDVSLDEYLSRVEERNKELNDFWRPVKPLRSDIRAVMTVIADRSAERRAYEDANKYRLDLRRANLQRADLVGVDLTKADLSEARLEGADLRHAKMEEANLRHAKMEGVGLSLAKMEGADLSLAKMKGANLSYAEMKGANLFNAKMEGADLNCAKMEGSDLSLVMMGGVDLSRAKLRSATLTLSNVYSANVSCTDFTGAVKLTPEQPDCCFGCAGTKLPKGLSQPDHWYPTKLNYTEINSAYQAWLTDHKVNSPLRFYISFK